jgi:hypothetical protein
MEPKFYKKQNVVKSYTRPLVLIIACILLVYTSCRKDSSSAPSTSTPVPSNSALSSQIAINVAKSLSGSFGGVNLNDGVDSVSVADHLGPHHACGCGSTNPLCGFFTDSLVNANSTEGDSVKIHTGGELKFYFNCVNNKLSGYTANDSLSTFRTNATSVSEYRVQQFYNIKALDSNHQFIGVDGNNTLKTFITSNGGSARSTGGAYYQFTDLTIDVINKDILSGTATFDAYGTNWDAHGTIKFLGNHMADFTMNTGQLYHVNLLTGKMTQ